MPNVYEQPQRNEFTSAHISNQCETDNTVVQPQTDETSFAHIPSHYETDKTHQKLPNGEPIYKDPGHKKKAIYEWVEQKGIFKFDRRAVRCLVTT